jgi:hypothetical protein
MKGGHIFNWERACFSGIAFPLILTFSLWEKEQPLDHCLKFACQRAEGRRRLAESGGTCVRPPAAALQTLRVGRNNRAVRTLKDCHTSRCPLRGQTRSQRDGVHQR